MKHSLTDRGPSVLDFAQLSLDVYNDPKDDNERKLFSSNWTKMDSYPPDDSTSIIIPNHYNPKHMANENGSCAKTGFYARVYASKKFAYSVLCFRGSDDTNDFIEDANFANNISKFKQAEMALNFFKLISNNNKYLNSPIKYLCGHSLGGILSKIIVPQTGTHACAFNSPGVLEYLMTNKMPYHVKNSQIIKTYVAINDEVGELKGYAELGERIHLATSNLNTIREEYPITNELPYDILHPNQAASNLAVKNRFKYKKVMPFHSMKDLFLYLHKNSYENVFLDKKVNYDEYLNKYLNLKKTKDRIETEMVRQDACRRIRTLPICR